MRLRVLLIAESPPDPGAGERQFFYAPELRANNLFRGVAAAMCGERGDIDVTDQTDVASTACRTAESGSRCVAVAGQQACRERPALARSAGVPRLAAMRPSSSPNSASSSATRRCSLRPRPRSTRPECECSTMGLCRSHSGTREGSSSKVPARDHLRGTGASSAGRSRPTEPRDFSMGSRAARVVRWAERARNDPGWRRGCRDRSGR